MRTTGSVTEVRELIAEARREGHRVGCVPTMGALHRGHTSLIQAAVADCDFVVVTLFVNGPQFNDPDDFLRYPRRLEDDLTTCQEKGVNVVFAPDEQTIYPPGGQTTATPSGPAILSCGRPQDPTSVPNWPMCSRPSVHRETCCWTRS